MLIDKIKTAISTIPFRSFQLETRGGSKITVEKPEWFFEIADSDGELIIYYRQGVCVVNIRDLTDYIFIEG